MRTGARSQPPQWLFILIAVVGSLGIAAAAFVYIDRGGKRGGGLAEKDASGTPVAGTPGRASSNATISGTARSVEIAGAIGLNSLTVDTGAQGWSVRSDGDPITGRGPVTVGANGIIASVFRAFIGLEGTTFAARDGTVQLPDGATVDGTVVHGNHIELDIGTVPVPWFDPPGAMEFHAVGQFSWAGSGEIAVADQHLTGEFLGAMGSFTVILTRTAEAVRLQGSGVTQQAFVDGQPVLRTTATIERLRTDITAHAGDANDSTYVTWAPRDTGPFGMCILRIVPKSGPAEWVNVGLQHMPPMFGGEQHEEIGGDTSGLGSQGRFFGGPDAIDSFIGVADADKRDLSLNVPAGTPPGEYVIEVQIEGNFDPVVFSMKITVAG